jgi:hypothetical protein
MHRKNLRVEATFFIFLFLLLPCLLAAQETEYKDYMVIRGDTLWDISNKELQDSFLWPKVWKENPEIGNPDRIYPGQKIKIPLYLLQKEIKPEPKPVEVKRPAIEPAVKEEKPVEAKVEPVKKGYIVSKHILLASGYISDKIPSVGIITDTPTGRSIIGKDDYAFITTEKPVKKGDRFYIFHVMEKVKHPKTGRKLGYLIDVVGEAEVVGQEENDDPKIMITNAYTDISTGYFLDNYYEVEPLKQPDSPRKPDVGGYVVASKHLHLINVPYDIAYIDKGSRDGLKVGDLLSTLEQGKHKIYNGIIQIINPRETTSTVIIKKSNEAIEKGDIVLKVKPE